MLQEEPHQFMFGGREGHRTLAAPGLPRRRIEPEVGKPKLQLVAGRSPAQLDPDSRQQLGKGKRLDKIIVGSLFQTGNAITDGISGGEDDDRKRGISGTEAPANLEAMHARHEEVEDDQIRPGRRGLAQRVLSMVGGRDKISFQRQTAPQRPPDLGVIINDQNVGHQMVLALLPPREWRYEMCRTGITNCTRATPTAAHDARHSGQLDNRVEWDTV